MPVRSDATRMSTRPKTAPLPVIWPSPLTSLNLPLTVIRPHTFLILKVNAERSGTRFQTPAVSGSFSSVSTVVISTYLLCAAAGSSSSRSSRCALCIVAERGLIARLLLIALRALHRRRAGPDCPAPPHRAARSASSPSLTQQGGEVGWVEILIDATDQPVCAQLDHNAHPHGDRSAGAAHGVQDVLLDEPVVKQLPVQDLVAALGGRIDEPVDHAQCARLVTISAGTDPPHGDVVAPQTRHCGCIAVFDGREQLI